MEEPITKEQLLQSIKELEIQLEQLESNKTEAYSTPKENSAGLDYLKATEDLKDIIRIKGLIRKYRHMLMQDLYKKETTPFVEDLLNSSELPEFSWGIREKEEKDREVIFEQTDSKQDYIKVTNYGKFEYLTGQNGVHIMDMPDSDNITINMEHFLKYNDKTRLFAEDINETTRKHPEYMGEKLYLLRITKGVSPNQRNYFVLSPINKSYLEDEDIRKFFVKEYCSDLYLDSLTKGENGIYAGNVSKSEEGFYTIKYSKASTRAAKLAELIPGSTQLHVDFGNGDSKEISGVIETFVQIRERFNKELDEQSIDK